MNKDLEEFNRNLRDKQKEDITEEEWDKIAAEIKFAHFMSMAALNHLNLALYGYDCKMDETAKAMYKARKEMLYKLYDILKGLDEKNYYRTFLSAYFTSDVQDLHAKDFAEYVYDKLGGNLFSDREKEERTV